MSDNEARFIDLHCHGALGHAFDDAHAAGIAQAVRFHHHHGTGRMVLSLVSAPVPVLCTRLAQLRPVVAQSPSVIGIHLEGPFLSPERRGAHDERALNAPSTAQVSDLLAAADGVLTQVTLAPELPGALDAIASFADAGVVVAVGHTQADYDTTHAAFQRGARLLTHTFNAMPGLHHRDTGPIGAALERDDVVLEVIADGMHVRPVIVRSLFAAAPGRIALVTDAMSATGLGDGAYALGGLNVDVLDGRPRLAGTDTLAGSTLTMQDAVKNAIRFGVPEVEAIRAATETPAAVLSSAPQRRYAADNVTV